MHIKIHNIIERTGKVMGVSNRTLKEGFKSLKKGYKDGLIYKCPRCNAVFDNSDKENIAFLKKNKMCNNCFPYNILDDL